VTPTHSKYDCNHGQSTAATALGMCHLKVMTQNLGFSAFRGKHLRALLRAFKQGGGYSTDGSVHTRHSDLMFRSVATSHGHSLTSLDSFVDSHHHGGSKASDSDRMEPAIHRDIERFVGGGDGAGTRSPVGLPVSTTGRRLDRSQLSFLRANKGRPQSTKHEKHLSWSDMQYCDPRSLDQLPSSLPLSLSLREPLTMVPDGSLVDIPRFLNNPSFHAEPLPLLQCSQNGCNVGSCASSSRDQSQAMQSRAVEDDDGESGSVIIHDGLSLDTSVGAPAMGDASQALLESSSTASTLVKVPSSSADAASRDRVVTNPTSSWTSSDVREDAGQRRGPVAEAYEPIALPSAVAFQDPKKPSNSVSFQVQGGKNLHRHKSSNYSRVLDIRVDDWCALLGFPLGCLVQRGSTFHIFEDTALMRCQAMFLLQSFHGCFCECCRPGQHCLVTCCGPVCRLPQSDPLNVPAELREKPDTEAAVARQSIHAMSTSTLCSSPSSMPLAPLYLKRRTSTEIMRGLPDKLRGQAEHAQSLADSALNSFVIVNAALQRSSALGEFVSRPDVQRRMGDNFRVGMGFGLHTGCVRVHTS
jgi:hypothetical protein